MTGNRHNRHRSPSLPFAPLFAIPCTAAPRTAPWWGVAASGVGAAAATLALPGGTVPVLWDGIVALRPGQTEPALGLSIALLVGAVAWIAARGVGRRQHPVEVALIAALTVFLLAPAPLDPSPLPFALLGLAWIRVRGSAAVAANDNAGVAIDAPFHWRPARQPVREIWAPPSIRSH